MMFDTLAQEKLRQFRDDESGAALAWNLFWCFAFIVFGGLAIDSSNAWRVQAQLQATADAAALAAAVQGTDQTLGKEAASAAALRNMPAAQHGTVLDPVDISYGIWDSSSGAFTPDTSAPDAIKVTVKRASDNSNTLRTHILGTVGLDHWDIGATSIAAMRTGGAISCAGATIMTENFMDTGGGNEWTDGVCLYGGTGVRTGGNDLIEPGVRIGATDIEDVVLNSPRPGSAPEEQVKFGSTVAPVILPQLAGMYSALNADLTGSTYSGDLLPGFIFDADGNANVVYIDQGWWTVQNSDEIQPNTIYVVNHGMQFAGGVDASNVAFIVNGQIGVGGGPALQFDNVYMFANGDLNFSGDVMWGDQAAVCGDGKYRAYLFSTTSLSLGGFGSSTGAYGVIGAAPRFSPGGALKNAGGLYFEASQYTSLGGDMRIQGCGEALAGDIDVAEFPAQGGGSYLVR